MPLGSSGASPSEVSVAPQPAEHHRARGLGRKAPKGTVASRRQWSFFVASVLTAALIVVAWFPLDPLSTQRSTLSSDTVALSTLTAEDHKLADEISLQSTVAEIDRIGRIYQEVPAGQELYEVLPPSRSPVASNGGPAPFAGDPGLQPLAAPSGSVLLDDALAASTPAALSAPAVHASTPVASGGSSLWSRAVATLEFWR